MRNLASKEQELLRLASQLDVEALAEIYDRYSPALYNYAMRLLGDTALAEDCVAETFARFLKSLQKGQGPRDRLQAYLYRITHNWVVDLYRNHEKTSELNETLQYEEFPGPEEEAAMRIRQKQIREALHNLTPNQQKVISLKYLEDWSNEEIARALHKTVGAVKSLQHHALVSLQKLLMEQPDEKSN
ncbi:MAG: sigma-70 family RNA polymerase sigma factor [Chloroflexi bacterium]|nr:MAG: sigma-70 family RNA polymerase sigma factor [Chloroflexota bacterium]